jgi:hypothetical protein
MNRSKSLKLTDKELLGLYCLGQNSIEPLTDDQESAMQKIEKILDPEGVGI